MSMYRGLYFATLAGAIGGLAASCIAALLNVALSGLGLHWLPDAVTMIVFGTLVASAMYLYFDKLLLGRYRASAVGYGCLLGSLGGVLAAVLAAVLAKVVERPAPALFRLSTWALCFSVIGLGLGLRWAKANVARVLHTYAGGLAGGLLGGLIFVLFTPHLSAGIGMCGLMFAGAGMGFGAGIAPVLVREGVMRFVSSGDARAQNKLGKNKAAWDMGVDESYVLGSAQTAQDGSKFQQGADIYIPDSAVAPRHAVVFSKEGRFFVARHPDAAGPEGVARYVLRVKGKTVLNSQELLPADDLLIGRTALRFDVRRRGEA